MLWVAKHFHFLRINNKPIKYWTPAGGTLDVGNFSIFLIFKTPRQTEHGATDLSIVNCWNYCLSQKQKPTISFLNDILKKENYWASGSKHRKERQEGILESQADTNSFLREWLCELLNLRTISSCLCCNCWILLIMQLRVCIMKIMWFRLSKCFEHESWSSDISTLRIMVIVLHYTELCHNGYFLPSPCCSYQGAAKMLITIQISVVHINIDLKKKNLAKCHTKRMHCTSNWKENSEYSRFYSIPIGNVGFKWNINMGFKKNK